MNETFNDRLTTAAEAKKALLAKFRPKPTVTAPDLVPREEAKAAALAEVRKARMEAKAGKKQALADAEQAAREAEEAAAADALSSKRSAIKERKALTAAEAKEKRDARYAARKARQ